MSVLFRRLALCLAFLVPAAVAALPVQEAEAQQNPWARQVYVTTHGYRYHRAGCQYLAKSKWPTTIRNAVNNRYTACAVCKPWPRSSN